MLDTVRNRSLKSLDNALQSSLEALDSQRVILFGHLGLGDQISLAPALEAWAAVVPEVILPAQPRNVPNLSVLFSYVPNITVVGLEGRGPSAEESEVRELAKKSGASTVQAGRLVYASALKAFPEMGINRQLMASALVLRDTGVSENLRTHLLSLPDPYFPPEHPYAVLDHHPGTNREVPSGYLDRVTAHLHLLSNPREVRIHKLGPLLDCADALHLVSSAPLCLALTANLGSGRRVRYRVGNEAPLKQDYPADWLEFRLGTGDPAPVDRRSDLGSSKSMGQRDERRRQMMLSAIQQARL